MKKIILFFTIFSFLGMFAQTPKEVGHATGTEEKPNVVEIIMEESNGNIIIEIPETILPSILQNPSNGNVNGKKTNLKTGVNRMTGYRIQVFMDGDNQATLESRARSRANIVLSRFPKYRGQVYTFSNSPNWYCRVGNFQTAEEATNAMAELKKAFPNFSREMRIVKSPIVLIK